jgi:hypothetical protein
MDPVSLGIVGAAGVAGSVIGAIGAGRERRMMQEYLDKQNQENETWYNQNYYSDYTQRSDVQALMKTLRDNMKRQSQQAQSTAAITGATPEMTTAVQENTNKVISDTYSRIGAMGQAYKDSIVDQYLKQKNQLAGTQMSFYDNRAKSYENLMSNSVSGTLSGIGSILAQ